MLRFASTDRSNFDQIFDQIPTGEFLDAGQVEVLNAPARLAVLSYLRTGSGTRQSF